MIRLLLVMFCTGTLVAELPHPRLLMTSEQEATVKQRITSDPVMKMVHQVLLERAEEMLEERTTAYLTPDGRRLLAESRRAMGNVLYCGMAWRTTGDERFRLRVIRELDAASALKDWNPSHFLDTAEMAAAVAIGYDWLFPTLNAVQKKRYEEALIQKGLRAVKLKFGKHPWWFREAKSNWSQVCGTGMALAAIAVGEIDAELSQSVESETRQLLEACERLYQPAGGYAEGPGYWHYGTNYHVLGMAAFDGVERPLKEVPLLERAGDFILQIAGPTGRGFNFADGPARKKLPTPAQSWIAGRFQNQSQGGRIRAQLARELADGLEAARHGPGWKKGPGQYFPLHLLWLPRPSAQAKLLPLLDHFGGAQSLSVVRTGWAEDDAWLAIKGGTGAHSHGHLDVGSFVYEAGGHRWFHDLGADDYNLPGYFHERRWDYFRMTNASHSTLVIGGQNQATPSAGCGLTRWRKIGRKMVTTGDLSKAYSGQADEVTRTVAFDRNDGTVTVNDAIKAPTGPVRWAVISKAAFTIDGDRVVFEHAGKRLVMIRHDQSGGQWQEFSMKPKTEREHQNQGCHAIGFLVDPKPDLSFEVSWELD